MTARASGASCASGRAGDCPRRLNGSTRAAPTATMTTVAVMTDLCLQTTHGTTKIRVISLILLVKSWAMPGACTTCMAMSGSGVRTGTVPTRLNPPGTLRGRQKEKAACCVAVPGTSTQSSALRGAATTTHPGAGSTRSVFVWRELYLLTPDPLYHPVVLSPECARHPAAAAANYGRTNLPHSAEQHVAAVLPLAHVPTSE